MVDWRPSSAAFMAPGAAARALGAVRSLRALFDAGVITGGISTAWARRLAPGGEKRQGPKLEIAKLHGLDDRLGPIGKVQNAQDIADAIVDRTFGKLQLRRNLLVGLPPMQNPQHV